MCIYLDKVRIDNIFIEKCLNNYLLWSIFKYVSISIEVLNYSH